MVEGTNLWWVMKTWSGGTLLGGYFLIGRISRFSATGGLPSIPPLGKTLLKIINNLYKFLKNSTNSRYKTHRTAVFNHRNLPKILKNIGKRHEKNLKKPYGPFLWTGFNCFKATEPLQGDSLLFTTKSPGSPGTYFINIISIEGWVNFGASSGFQLETPGLGIQCLNHLAIASWIFQQSGKQDSPRHIGKVS